MNTITERVELVPPRLAQHRPMRLSGLSLHFTRESAVGGIPALWERFMARVGTVPGELDNVVYGACYNADSEGGFDYVAAVEVDRNASLPAGLTALELPARRYAIFVHQGDIANIDATWAEIFGRGLFDAGLRIANAPAFERYDERFDPATGEGIVEIWVPVMD